MERLHLFEAHGVEIEYAIVSEGDLSVLPVADRLLVDEQGRAVSDVERGRITWCNELAAHVVELKTTSPEPSLAPLPELFQAEVREVDRRLAALGARLLPTGMHPLMDPERETRLWPHAAGEVYRAFDRIFSCRGHGWSNLTSVQLNLPFADDSELVRLHAAVRLLLPIMPALSASTPYVEGKAGGWMDERMRYYRSNCRRVPSVTGLVVPEDVASREQYEREILGRMFADMQGLDPEGVLRHEWLNARGATARYDRWAIEIRVLDTQECPRADLALLAAITAVLRALVEGRWSDLPRQRAPSTEGLAEVLDAVCIDAERTPVRMPALLEALGRRPGSAPSAGELWAELLGEAWPAGSEERQRFGDVLELVTTRGCLARRIARAVGSGAVGSGAVGSCGVGTRGKGPGAEGTDPPRDRILEVYRSLADCLREGRPFHG